jgi:phage gp36-like protein
MYCAPSDLYDFGLPRGALRNPGRHVRVAVASTDTIPLDVHGFDLNDAITFRVEGVSGALLPAPLVAGTEYFAIPLSESAFSVALEADGDAIDLTTNGSNFRVNKPIAFDAAILWASRIIDDMLVGHVVPLEAPYPEIVTMTCAELAAGKLLAGKSSKSLTEMFDAARKRLERWSTGATIRGENAPDPANLAASATVPYADPRGWNRFGGL